MKLIFDEMKKTRMVGIRLTAFDYERIRILSNKNRKKIGEVCRALITSALKEVEKHKKISVFILFVVISGLLFFFHKHSGYEYFASMVQ